MNQPIQTGACQEDGRDGATFKVILQGVHPNILPSEAKVKLAALFKASAEQIDHLLARPGFVVKKAISSEVASRYKAAIESAGGTCEVVPEDPPIIPLEVDLPNAPLPQQAKQDAASTKPEGKRCPQCAADLDAEAAFCTSCGERLMTTEAVPAAPLGAEASVSSAAVTAPPEKKIWWLSREGKQHGPYSRGDLQQMMISKSVAGNEKVWTEGLESWQPISSLPELNLAALSSSGNPPPLPSPLTRRLADLWGQVAQFMETLWAQRHKINEENANRAVNVIDNFFARHKISRRSAFIGAAIFGVVLLASWMAFHSSAPGASDIKPFVMDLAGGCELMTISNVRKTDGIPQGERQYRIDFIAELSIKNNLNSISAHEMSSTDGGACFHAWNRLMVSSQNALLSEHHEITGYGILVKSERGWKHIKGGVQGISITPK